MRVLPRPRSTNLSKRKLMAYAVCLAVFAAAVWGALRLSFPPDPVAYKMRLTARSSGPTQVAAEHNALAIRQGDSTQHYRLYQTKDGLVAEEVELEEP